MSRTYLNLIGGEWEAATGGATKPDVNPARMDEVVAVFPSAGREDASRAAEAAARAFPGWAHADAEAGRDPAQGRVPPRAASFREPRLDEVAEGLTAKRARRWPKAKASRAA